VKKRNQVQSDQFSEGDPVIVTNDKHIYNNRRGVINRLGSAGEDVTYAHVQLDGIQTIIAFRFFELKKGS
jgi:hypothetical protein